MKRGILENLTMKIPNTKGIVLFLIHVEVF